MARSMRMPMLLAMGMLAACARPGPEARLHAQLDLLGAAIEARDVGALEGVLTEDFIGPDAMDRTQARRFAQLAFLRYRDVHVALGPPQVTLSGDGATVTLTAALAGSDGAVFPESANAYRVRSGWRLVDGQWRLVSAEWSPMR